MPLLTFPLANKLYKLLYRLLKFPVREHILISIHRKILKVSASVTLIVLPFFTLKLKILLSSINLTLHKWRREVIKRLTAARKRKKWNYNHLNINKMIVYLWIRKKVINFNSRIVYNLRNAVKKTAHRNNH